MKVRVRVPATSANLGSGFDCAGIALGIYNYFEFEPAEKTEIIGTDEKYANEKNPVYTAYRAVCDKYGKDPRVKITFKKTEIPISRGLGSSAALLVAGAYAAAEICGVKDKKELADICTAIEGHPDNVTPACYGGLCISAISDGKTFTVKKRVSEKLKFTVIIPDFELSTDEARKILPKTVDRKDAIYNLTRAALLSDAYGSGDKELIKVTAEDRLHESYRKSIMRNVSEVEKAAYSAGALTFSVSGAGSACLCVSEFPLAEKLNEVLKYLENGWKAIDADVDNDGAKVEKE